MNINAVTNNMTAHLLAQLPASATAAEVHPWTEQTDAEIVLGGSFDGCRIQVGPDYYVVAMETEDDGIVQIDGRGDLSGELAQVVSLASK